MSIRVLNLANSLDQFNLFVQHKIFGFLVTKGAVGDEIYLGVKVNDEMYIGAKAKLHKYIENKELTNKIFSNSFRHFWEVKDLEFCEPYLCKVLKDYKSSWYINYVQNSKSITDKQVLKILNNNFKKIPHKSKVFDENSQINSVEESINDSAIANYLTKVTNRTMDIDDRQYYMLEGIEKYYEQNLIKTKLSEFNENVFLSRTDNGLSLNLYYIHIDEDNFLVDTKRRIQNLLDLLLKEDIYLLSEEIINNLHNTDNISLAYDLILELYPNLLEAQIERYLDKEIMRALNSKITITIFSANNFGNMLFEFRELDDANRNLEIKFLKANLLQDLNGRLYMFMDNPN